MDLAELRGTVGGGRQDDAYADRFSAMGVPRDRIAVTGSMKFDTARIEDGVEGAEQACCAGVGMDRSRR